METKSDFLSFEEKLKNAEEAPTPTSMDKDYIGVLSEKLVKRYSSEFEKINSELPRGYEEGGFYLVPEPTLVTSYSDGFTEYKENEPLSVLNPPATMVTKNVKYKTINYTLRVAVPWESVDEVYNSEIYFNQFFDSLISQSFNSVASKYGRPKFGRVFFSIKNASRGILFDYGEGLEIRFYGSFIGERAE